MYSRRLECYYASFAHGRAYYRVAQVIRQRCMDSPGDGNDSVYNDSVQPIFHLERLVRPTDITKLSFQIEPRCPTATNARLFMWCLRLMQFVGYRLLETGTNIPTRGQYKVMESLLHMLR